jgi:hypothetical protein
MGPNFCMTVQNPSDISILRNIIGFHKLCDSLPASIIDYRLTENEVLRINFATHILAEKLQHFFLFHFFKFCPDFILK